MKISTLKGIYSRGETVRFRLGGQDFISGETDLLLKFHHLDELIHETKISGAADEIAIDLPQNYLPDGARGYGCSCDFIRNGKRLASDTTAFDFANPQKPVLRYGFLSDFGEDVADSEEALDFLAEFHISHVQFYDWTYRHHEYRGPASVYRDTMGKVTDMQTVKNKIEGCRTRGMKTLGYGAVYAAGEDYRSAHPEQSLYDADGYPYNLIDKFFIMDIREESPWRKHLMEQYRYAVEDAGFDGIHMDTYGFPKRAFALDRTEKSRRLVHLEDDFPGIIAETRKTLGSDAVLLFNNVGNWPVHKTGPTDQDGVYIEVWDPHDSYSHIRSIIIDAAGYGKPVILAAYLAPFRLEENHGGERALNAALILHAAIASLGATHLLLGENATVLTQGYYNDYTRLREDERSRLRRYYDFQVRYMDVLNDPSLAEISETHTAGENREYFFSGAAVSADGRPGTVWVIVRENRNRKVVSMINLTSQMESFWNRGKEATEPVNSFLLQLPADGEPEKVYAASPDRNGGLAYSLTPERVRNERGPALQISLEDLPLWTVLVAEYRDRPCGMHFSTTTQIEDEPKISRDSSPDPRIPRRQGDMGYQ